MRSIVTTLLGAGLACAALAASAQAPAGEPGKGPMGGHRMFKPCSEEADPAKCEAQRKQMRENMKAAHEACKNSQDMHGCMMQQMCAKAPDPAKCQERAKERHARMMKRMDEMQAAHEACTGKRGDELMKCLGEQRKMHRGGKPETKS
jgi:hypothetical protein